MNKDETIDDLLLARDGAGCRDRRLLTTDARDEDV
jgi:hypothetical protein